jgi:hypothetical protein
MTTPRFTPSVETPAIVRLSRRCQPRKRHVAVVLAAVAVSTLLGRAGAAQADISQQQSFTAILRGGPTGDVITVVARGLVNGVGSDIEGESQPGDPDNLNRDTFVFPRGTLSVLATINGEPGPADPRSCMATFDVGGTFEVNGGTGAFAGAHGTGTVSGTGRLILQRGPQGCLDEEPPALLVIIFRLTGTLTLPQLAAA